MPGPAEPTVEVMSVSPITDGHRIVCRFSASHGEPVAPGALYTDPRSGQERFAVHRAVGRNGNLVTFETFGPAAAAPPDPGESYFHRCWWVWGAMDAALDTSAVWVHREYPDDGDHAHCLFTWVTIASYAAEKSGYFSDEHGWITEQAFRDYIRDDVYRLRAATESRPSET